jgi:2-amino-4-hydroxy-6-hydroxymethyldihydropteridine diphosphokinase
MTETPNPHIVDADTLTGEMRPIRRCVISIGSNLGDRLAKLQGALDSLVDTPDETVPVDAPEDSGAFLNAVILLDTTLPARVLLERALAIETAFGRESSEIRNAPRELDVDLILVGDRRSDEEWMRLPHPRAHERAFVLAPWADVDKDASIPEVGSVADLLDKVGRSGVNRRDDLALEMH